MKGMEGREIEEEVEKNRGRNEGREVKKEVWEEEKREGGLERDGKEGERREREQEREKREGGIKRERVEGEVGGGGPGATGKEAMDKGGKVRRRKSKLVERKQRMMKGR